MDIQVHTGPAEHTLGLLGHLDLLHKPLPGWDTDGKLPILLSALKSRTGNTSSNPILVRISQRSCFNGFRVSRWHLLATSIVRVHVHVPRVHVGVRRQRHGAPERKAFQGYPAKLRCLTGWGLLKGSPGAARVSLSVYPGQRQKFSSVHPATVRTFRECSLMPPHSEGVAALTVKANAHEKNLPNKHGSGKWEPSNIKPPFQTEHATACSSITSKHSTSLFLGGRVTRSPMFSLDPLLKSQQPPLNALKPMGSTIGRTDPHHPRRCLRDQLERDPSV